MLLMFWITATLSPSLVWQSQAGDGFGFNSSQHDQSPPNRGRPAAPLPSRFPSNNKECANHSVKDFLITYQRKVYSLKSLMRELTKIDVKTPCESNLLLKAVQKRNQRESSCRGRCGLKQRNSNMLCFCDIHCSHFGDCCYDFHSSCSQDKLRVGSFDTGSTTCGIANQPTWHGEAMISTCPPSLNNKTKESSCFSDDRTLNLRLEVPVIDRRNDRTYRSVTCASCNNITDVIPWVLKVSKCQFLKNVTNIIDWLKQHPGQCSRKYEAPSPGQNDVKCILRMSLNSPRASLKCGKLPVICDICNSYAMVFNFEGKHYRNPHCVLCDPNSGKSGHSPETSIRPPPPLTVLINFNTNVKVPDVSAQHVNKTNTSRAAKEDRQQTVDAEQVITMVGCYISIVALLVLIVVYALFKELRNLPGKVLMNLACSIICFQAVFLSSGETGNRAVCVAIAVLLHYFSLASFVWMAVMGYDLAKTFTSNGINVHQNCATKKLVIYCCFAWGGPLVLVALCFTLDVTGSAYFGYGMGEVCWIHSGFAKVFSFGVPVALTLSFNLVAIMRTMIAIHQTKKVTQRVATQRAQTSLAFLCVKLTVVLGVPWVLGYVKEYTLVVRYTYIVLNAFQGLFISLVFLASKRVFKIIRRTACNVDSKYSATARKQRSQATRTTHAYYQETKSFREDDGIEIPTKNPQLVNTTKAEINNEDKTTQL